MCHNEISVQGTGTPTPPPWKCAGSKGKFGFINANSEGSGESAHLLGLVWLAQMAI